MLLSNQDLFFSLSSIQTKSVFELLHLNIWGPYQSKTHDGCNQFLTIVDDFSRYIWVHLPKHKSDVTTVMVKFAAHIATQFQLSIKSIRSENAKKVL